jgi:hypothetical protein
MRKAGFPKQVTACTGGTQIAGFLEFIALVNFKCDTIMLALRQVDQNYQTEKKCQALQSSGVNCLAG